jgi:hypothetical protein
MEQQVLDSKLCKIRTLNVDTRFRDISSQESTDFQFTLPSPLKNIIRFRLVSCEIPNVAYTFSPRKNNLSFRLVDAEREYVIMIAQGNYTVDSLLEFIQGQFDTLAPGFKITLVPGGHVKISANRPFILDFLSQNPLQRTFDFGLGYNLGFRNKKYKPAKDLYIGPTCECGDEFFYVSEGLINVTGDTYYLLDIQDMEIMDHKSVDGSALRYFTKLILNQHQDMICFDYNSHMIRREITFPQPVNIKQLRIRIMDTYGQVVDLNQANYSLTFEVTEITDTTQYEKFVKGTYARMGSELAGGNGAQPSAVFPYRPYKA